MNILFLERLELHVEETVALVQHVAVPHSF